MNRSRRRLAIAQGVTAVTLWGASFVATKVALTDIDPFTVIWIRFGLGVLVLGTTVVVRRSYAFPGFRELSLLVLLGFIGITLHQWLQVTGLLTARASTTAWIIATSPVFIALLGRVFLNESLSRGRVIGIALATFGVLLTTTDGELRLLTHLSLGAPGNLLIMGSAMTWAVFSVLSRYAVRDRDVTLSLFFVMGSGWALSTPFLLVSGVPSFDAITTEGWMALVFLGVFCSGIAYIFWYNALQAIPASQAGSLLFLEPPVTVLIAALILGEAVTIVSIASGLIILLGVWMVTRLGHHLKTDAPSPEGRRDTPGLA